MDKILRIDMGAPGGPKTTVDPLGKYEGMGGRGMTSMVVSEEVPADCHPLGRGKQIRYRSGYGHRIGSIDFGPHLRGM